MLLSTEMTDHVRGKWPDDLVFAGIRNGHPLRVGADADPLRRMTGSLTPAPADSRRPSD
jgi:hypothetical protein